MAAILKPLVEAPRVGFLQAIQAIEDAGIIPDVMRMAVVTLTTAKDQKQFGALKDDPLSVEGTAFLMKYSAEDTVPPLYRDMNDKCYDSDRSKIKPYGPFVVETVKHMKEVQAYPNGTVFRGVKADLREAYPEGRELTWHGFCSTTKSIRVLEQELFCGVVGKRTQFMIELTQGQARDISLYSLIGAEDEVLLPPGCRFKVISVMVHADGLTQIQLKEIFSTEWIIDLSDSTPTAPAPAPVSSIAVLSDLLKANGIAPADLLELSEGSLTELIDTAPLASRAAIGREIKAIKEAAPEPAPAPAPQPAPAPAPEPAPAPAPVQLLDPSAVSQLKALGFNSELVSAALIRNEGDVQVAAEWLLAHAPAPVLPAAQGALGAVPSAAPPKPQ